MDSTVGTDVGGVGVLGGRRRSLGRSLLRWKHEFDYAQMAGAW